MTRDKGERGKMERRVETGQQFSDNSWMFVVLRPIDASGFSVSVVQLLHPKITGILRFAEVRSLDFMKISFFEISMGIRS